MPSGACVIRYAGKRGVVWRIKYADADGKRVMETVGAASPIAVMATAEHRSMQTTKGYLHLAGTVFPDDAANLERRMLGVEGSGRKSPETADLGGSS